MRKLTIIGFAVMIVSFGCSVTKPSDYECQKIRSGDFRTEMYNLSGMGHWTRMTVFNSRTDSLLFLRNSKLSETSIFRIVWTENCTYKTYIVDPRSLTDSLIAGASDGKHNRSIKITDT